MADPAASPIAQLLQTLGITRQELVKHSAQMRQFLDADNDLASRVSDRDTSSRSLSGSDLQSNSRSTGPTRTFARSLSRTSSSSVRESSPPSTPVKLEPLDPGLPHRRMDSMEMVIERQRRQRKSRRERERDSSRNRPHPPSPSPSNASFSGQSQSSAALTRDDPILTGSAASLNSVVSPEPAPVAEPPPVTPQKNKYYREHTNLSSHSQSRKDATCKTETPTPTRPQPLPQFYAYAPYMGYPPYLPLAYRSLQTATPNTVPITPQTQRVHQMPIPAAAAAASSSKSIISPLPPSSPLLASSPMSSPARRVVNLVSSPGPMGPEPEETEYDNLPYKLPPGPYLSTKPDLSYAALIGRAIISSPEHRLTLQEIYDWITIVCPYYKRGETTWMNSIRHVLSTTVVFRKVPRDRSVGRTLWAIYDEDLECFKDGGFKKHLCKDLGGDGKDKASNSKGKGARARKRTADDDDADRKPKRARKDQGPGDSSVVHSSFLAQTPLVMHPLFPSRATPHLQPYYQSLLPQSLSTVPADVIFPPLPATAYSRIASAASVSSSTSHNASTATSKATSPPSSSVSESSPPPPTIISSSASASSSAASSTSSLPELTPSRHSSSPPSSLPATSDLDIDMHDADPKVLRTVSSTVVIDPGEDGRSMDTDSQEDVDSIFNTTLLGPVKFWKDEPKSSETGGLQPGIELHRPTDHRETRVVVKKAKKEATRTCKAPLFPPIPTSPTLLVRANQRKQPVERPITPTSTAPGPTTPPSRNKPATTHKTSSIRTPLSYKGLHMSPSTSLAHYKSHLDPPPVYSGGVAPLDVSQPNAPSQDDELPDPTRTPRKRNVLQNAISIFGHPVTPKKLVFSTSESPYRTPQGMLGGRLVSANSPLRTPRSGGMYDPQDPRTLLDDELHRMSSYDIESPAGLFGKERSSLLYDSPGLEGYKWW